MAEALRHVVQDRPRAFLVKGIEKPSFGAMLRMATMLSLFRSPQEHKKKIEEGAKHFSNLKPKDLRG